MIPVTITYLNNIDTLQRDDGGINIPYLATIVARVTNYYYEENNPELYMVVVKTREEDKEKKEKKTHK